MGKTLDIFKYEFNKKKFIEGKGAYLKINGVSKDEPDFIKDCQEICLMIAPYSAQEDPTFILGEKRPQPLIGACLFANNTLYCSSRSGKRIGNHAEYTIIQEAQSDNVSLSDSVLFTSLEPCTKHSRHPWTTSCAEYIVEVGIPEVYFGCLDANPVITGIGIKRLLDHCEVHSFDLVNVNRSKEINKKFFDFFDSRVDEKILKDVADYVKPKCDEFAVKLYLDKNNKKDREISYDEWFCFFADMIENHSITKGEITKYDVTPDFALAFYKDPSIVVPNYFIDVYDQRSMTNNNVEKTTAKVDFKPKSLISAIANTKEPNGNIYRIIAEKKLKALADYNFKELSSFVFVNSEAGREMIINALVHADYANGRAGIEIKISDDNLVICNPIADKNVVTDLQNKNQYSLPHNPRLMRFLNKAGLVESKHYGVDMLLKQNENQVIGFSGFTRQNVSYLETTIPLK